MREVGICIRITAAAVFFLLAVCFCTKAGRSSDIAAAVLSPQPLPAGQAGAICELEMEQEQPVGNCFWGEVPDTQLSCRETGGSSLVTAVLTVGNPELVVPGSTALAYQENGCFLDTRTANELFGTEQASGQIVWCGDSSYTVYGTFESMEQMMIRQAEDTDGEVLDMVSLHLTGSQPGLPPDTRGAQQFLVRHNLSGEIIDYLFLNALAGDLLLVLPLFVGSCLIRMACAQAKAADTLCKKAVFSGLAVLSAAAAVYLVLQHFRLPPDMIPTQWSDFSFWETWWETQRRNLLLLLGTAQGETQLAMLWNLLLSFLCNLLAVFAGFSLRLSFPRERKQRK